MARGIRYAFAVGGVFPLPNAKKADPQKLGEALAKVERDGKGKVQARATWRAAEGKPRHPFFPHFDWDNEKAGNHWRDQQARILINTIRIVDDDGDDRGPAYFNLTAPAGRAYRSHSVVMASVDFRNAVIVAAHRDMENWCARYRELKEICELVESARKLLAKMKDDAPDDPEFTGRWRSKPPPDDDPPV